MYRALIICNSRFPEGRGALSELHGPKRDGFLLRDVLIDHEVGLFDKSEVRNLNECESGEVRGAIEEFFRAGEPDDTLLLYYSGHGRTHYQQLFLCTQDTNIDKLHSTAVAGGMLKDIVAGSLAQVTILILDCCYSAMFKGEDIAAEFAGTGRYVIAAASATGRASDGQLRGQPSPFTKALVDALHTQAADHDGDGLVDLDDVYNYLDTVQFPEARPHRKFDGSGAIPIARRAIRKPPAGEHDGRSLPPGPAPEPTPPGDTVPTGDDVAVAALEAAQGDLPYLDRLVLGASYSPALVDSFRAQMRADLLDKMPASLPAARFLQQAGLMRRGRLTYAGLLLFGENPTTYLPAAIVQCIRFYGSTVTAPVETVDLQGSVPELIVKARDFIAGLARTGELPTADGAYAQAAYRYPMIAVREIIANAIVHRDYSDQESCVQIRAFDDRIEILNPGNWAGASAPESGQLPLGQLARRSAKRNFRLAQTLTWSKLVEGVSAGVPRSIADCESNGAPEPTVAMDDRMVQVTIFPRPSLALDGGATGPSRTEDTDRVTTPVGRLLDQITEVIEVSYPGARMRRIEGHDGPPHLLVTHVQDGFTRQWRVAAHVGDVTLEVIEAFAAQTRSGGPEASPALADAALVNAELVCSGPRPGQVLRTEALRLGIRVRSFTEFQGLLDLRNYVANQADRLAADRRYPHALYVPQRFRELEAGGADRPGQLAGNDLVGEVLDELARDAGRFVLLLADFGRGKTFAMRELARRIPEQLPHLIPIYIELRELDKAHSVDGLIAAHLANWGEGRIDLRAFRYMLAQGRIVLLFDGLDELATRVTFDRAADHLATLLSAAEGKAKIIVASRTQHFKSDRQVFTALGERVGLLPGIRMLGIEDFNDGQIAAYLRNWYGQEDVADERLRLIRDVQSLFGLSSNPRMLNFIAQLNADRLRAVAAAGQVLSGADLYAEILDSWLRYEHIRTQGIPGAPAGLTLDDLWRAVTALAMRLNESGETLIRLSDLAGELSTSLAELSGGPLTAGQHAHAIGSGTLLVRGEDGTFGFIHASVADWLVANGIARLLRSGDGVPGEAEALARQPLSQLTVDFLCDLAEPRALSRWMSRVLDDPRAGSVARANALRVGSRLRVSARTDLRGALLRGEDLSHRDLSRVDFTGADLTGARLVGTNLSGAVLASAGLSGARLDGADLSGADLCGADLSGARLTRADLSGARLDGSTWNRAALIDVRSLPPDAAELPELDGAAIAPGQPVDTEIAPSEVGVPYGYHEQFARLPQPLAYSGDGTLLAIGHSDGGVTLCDTGTGLPVRTLRGHRGRVYGTAYGAGDRILVTASSDATIRLWDTVTGEATQVIEVDAPGAWPAEVSPDGRYLTYGAPDGVVRLLDIATGSVALELPGHVAPVYTAAFGDSAPGEPILITGDRAGTVRVWDITAGALQARFSIPRGPVYRLIPCPGAGRSPESGAAPEQRAPDRQPTVFAAGGAAGALLLLDANGIVLAEFPGHTGSVYALAHHPGRRLLASGCTDGGVRLWDLAARARLKELDDQPGALYGLSFSPDGELLASASNDGLVRLTSVPEGRCRNELTAHKSRVWRPLFSPDGAQLATSSNDGTCRLWDAATGQLRHVVRGHGRRASSVAFSCDGALLAARGSDGVVRVWDAASGRQRHALTGTGDRLASAVFGPEPHLLAAAGNDGGVYLWNAATGVQEREMNVETERVWAQTFSPDGEVLATANDDDSVRLWYRSTGRNTLTITEHKGRVRSLSFAPDGRTLATGCDDRGVRVWDAETGDLRASMRGHRDRVFSVAFAPGGALLASAGNDGVAFLWDPSTGREVRRIAPNAGKLWTTAFTPDGQILATAGDDGAVRLWSVPDGALLHTLEGHANRVASIAFTPALSPAPGPAFGTAPGPAPSPAVGCLLASASDDGTVRLWTLGGTGSPALKMTLFGVDAGWAAFSPDGRYKFDGVIAGEFWHAIGTCRFEPGELDPYLPAIHRLPADAPF